MNLSLSLEAVVPNHCLLSLRAGFLCVGSFKAYQHAYRFDANLLLMRNSYSCALDPNLKCYRRVESPGILGDPNVWL
jgi:hypothetical protein